MYHMDRNTHHDAKIQSAQEDLQKNGYRKKQLLKHGTGGTVMREILFRGKRFDNGQWIYGDLRQYSKKHIGIYSFELQQIVRGIDPATVGQYTGLKDKNGKRIWEGDIVTRILFDKLYQYEVVYQTGYASFDGIRKGGFISFGNDGDCFEVIGNIHDNPELLEVRR